MKRVKTVIRKIHVDSLITILEDLYKKGVDYVDVNGMSSEGQDTIGLSFCEEYMDASMRDGFDTMDLVQKETAMGEAKIDVTLSEDDLNNLV